MVNKKAKDTAVYLEVGSKKVFAGAVDWPGWCRSGRDGDSALASLLAYAPRYAAALQAGGLSFTMPRSVADFSIVERLVGGAGTDFGVPEQAPAADSRPLEGKDLEHLGAILDACWLAFDGAAQAAEGVELRKGPRGGGRDLEHICQHVLEAAGGYLGRIGWKAAAGSTAGVAQIRAETREALAWATREGVPEAGPRGGKRWTLRYFVRRSAWHILDHAWEIEDRGERGYL